MKSTTVFARLHQALSGGPPGPDLVEPSWQDVLTSPDERQAASGYWREVTAALRERGRLARVNSHAVLRLVTAYIAFDRASAIVMRCGPSVDAHNWKVQLEAAQLATALECELGLSAGRRVVAR